MQRLKIKVNSDNDGIQIHKIKLDNTEKRIIKLSERFQGLILQQQKNKNFIRQESLKKGAQIIQHKGRPIPTHLQYQVADEVKTVVKERVSGKATEITEDCFVSPAMITVKKDKSGKIALDSRKLNEVTIKRKAQMPNMEELISRISRKIPRRNRK